MFPEMASIDFRFESSVSRDSERRAGLSQDGLEGIQGCCCSSLSAVSDCY